jgi:hypothetical protein
MRFMVTPFLVVVGAFFRKVHAAPSPRGLARCPEGLLEGAKATLHAGCRRLRRCAARDARSRHNFSARL